ncbi:beta-ketoacyl-ACP synthase III [Streptomyces sp. NPDC048567]|uniref:beta-ketoacyl-ACP synthase III n=1 Tax=Streptomyces sp. NPDC048567 TaxID=3365570 RepID=UPI00371368F3
MTGAPGGGAERAVICGIGHRLPDRIVTSAELGERLDTPEDWIVGRTGISRRRWVGPGEATSDLAVGAGRAALKSAGGGQIDALVLATTTPDRRCPATAPEVAARLGLGEVAAFDVSAVCTGFLYGLATGAGFLAAGLADRVLVIAAEAFSTLLDPDDRTTLPIFGDGAGAVVLRRGRADEPGALGPLVLGSDGERGDLITVEAGGARHPFPAPDDGSQYFRMRGREVFRQSVERMSSAAGTALDRAGWTLDDVDRVVTHQANARVSAALAERLGLPRERFAQNIGEVGNTAAASIPVLLAQAAADGGVEPGRRLLLLAFGGGLTWGATTLTWPHLELHDAQGIG